ncbi:hypothetical protein H0Z60_10665 [Ectothiorhodospiraceae bacterium WFHF3C12]|nr:hypothetical protein [Ectothiorhodospiraceae bacterium WFHF3C12]
MSDLTLRGVSGVVLAPAAASAAGLGVLAYIADGLGERGAVAVAVLQGVAVAAGLIAAAVVGSRRLTLRRGVLSYRSLSRRLRWHAADVVAVTYEGHPSQGWHAHITLHHADGEQLALNVYLWHQSQVAALLQLLAAANPALRLTPATRGYLAVVR